jgi:hypothetical protein
MPKHLRPMDQNAILFLGYNPSFYIKQIEHSWKQFPEWGEDPSAYFLWSNRANFDHDRCHQLHLTGATGSHPYFRPHRAICGNNTSLWNQIDLYPYRSSKKDDLKKLPPKFTSACDEIFLSILHHAKPRGIIVLDVNAAKKLERMNECRSIKASCSYELNLGNRGIPMILSGQTTRFDNYAFDRLAWHAKQVIPEL